MDETFEEERFLFPGQSCYPISPSKEMTKNPNNEAAIIEEQDQLIKIIEVLGELNTEDKSFISCDGTLRYLESVCS